MESSSLVPATSPAASWRRRSRSVMVSSTRCVQNKEGNLKNMFERIGHVYFSAGGHSKVRSRFSRFGCRTLYARLQTVWSLPGHSRQANKDHSPCCQRRPNGSGQLADKVVQPTTQSAEGCTYILVCFDSSRRDKQKGAHIIAAHSDVKKVIHEEKLRSKTQFLFGDLWRLNRWP